MRKKNTPTEVEQDSTLEQAELLVSSIENQNLNVGAQLKKARTKKKKDIEKIAAVLRIRPRYLEALEESRYEDFPGQTYALGFLRSYADFLGLDVDDLLVKYRRETSFIKPDPMEMPISERPTLMPSFKHLCMAFSIIVLICFFWYFLTYKDTQVKTISSALSNQQSVSIDPSSVVQEPITANEKVSNSVATISGNKSKKGHIQIVALEEVWIEIEQDDNLILSRTLKKGETYDVPDSKTEMFLKTGNAGGMDILVDGQKVKPLGPLGAVRSGVSLSADKLKKR